MYRTINYSGDTFKALEKRILEIKNRNETIVSFTLIAIEGEEK